MQKGLFITFEGGEGTGKSTQIKLFAEYLAREGIPYSLTREPGGSDGAEEIRSLLLKGAVDKWDKITEMLLFTAARRDHLVKKIWPEINRGITVVSDRFADSTKAYQGCGYGNDEKTMQTVENLYHMIAGDFKPDLTFILDIDPKIGVMRSQKRAGNNEQRFEDMDLSFHENLRAGFLQIAKNNPQRCVVVNADQTIENVHKDIVKGFVEKVK